MAKHINTKVLLTFMLHLDTNRIIGKRLSTSKIPNKSTLFGSNTKMYKFKYMHILKKF